MATEKDMDELQNFLADLEAAGALSGIWLQLPAVLNSIDSKVTKEALALLAIYFSFIDDGSPCLPLTAEILFRRWNVKWASLQIAQNKDREKSPSPVSLALLEKGIKDLPQADCLVSGDRSPFVLTQAKDGEKWLFARKYYQAKCSIEDCVPRIFTARTRPAVSQEELQACISHIGNIASGRDGRPFLLNARQAEALLRGQKESLIITGGPGTGKTTVVCFLLWELLANPLFENSPVYLAAPSGKAADRMKESINGGLSSLTQEERNLHYQRFAKLNSLSPRTIHRLLSFNPSQGSFSYNSKNQFPAHSVFVIDEASMIDIELFAALLQAIPDSARVFFLGDKNQLPSVEAGAVLADLISQRSESLVELTESKRFTENSSAGNLARALQSDEPLPAYPFQAAEAFTCGIPAPKGSNPVYFYSASTKKEIAAILDRWKESYYKILPELAAGLSPAEDQTSLEKLSLLWKEANKARILCAERQGLRGVESINQHIKACSGHFPGELLMVTQNQKMYNLYNGDCGIVVSFADEEEGQAPLLYLMLQKEAAGAESRQKPEAALGLEAEEKKSISSRRGEIFHLGSFMFYPLHYIAESALESAYAITIHKSQGSGYDNILIFLPENTSHPLLNRQLVYTAVTRTQGNTSIVASQASLEAARKTVIKRESLLSLAVD